MLGNGVHEGTKREWGTASVRGQHVREGRGEKSGKKMQLHISRVEKGSQIKTLRVRGEQR